MDKMRCTVVLIITFVSSTAMAVLLHFWGDSVINSNPLLSIPVVYVEFLFSFSFGACACRFGLFDRLRFICEKKGVKPSLVATSLLLLFFIRCMFDTAAGHVLYVAAFISLFVLLPTDGKKHSLVWRFLKTIGNHSMNMWMIHAFIYAYILDGIVYKLQSPLLIFAVVIGVTFLCSLAVDKIVNAMPVIRNMKK